MMMLLICIYYFFLTEKIYFKCFKSKIGKNNLFLTEKKFILNVFSQKKKKTLKVT